LGLVRGAGDVAVLQALQTALGAAKRNPVVFLAAAVFGLLQLPGILAQALDPLVGSIVSLGVSGLTLLVGPFFFGGIIGMANEAIDGRTSLGTFVREGIDHYLSILVVYLCLFVVNFAVWVVVVFAALFGGLFALGNPGEFGLLPLAVFGVVSGLAILAYLLVTFAVQFFGHAIVVDDLGAVDGLKRSLWCVRHNLVSVLGYTVVAMLGGGAFGLLAGAVSLLTSPQFVRGTANPTTNLLPVAVPAVGLAGVVALSVALVAVTALATGLFATFSTAFYRTVRPTDGRASRSDTAALD
jgi:hypothetical protein